MKNSIKIFSLTLALLVGTSAFAQSNKECSVYSMAKPIAKVRGKAGMVSKIPAKPVMLPKKASKSRGSKPECMISFYNYLNQKIHVFVDSNYVGSLQANSIGVVESLKKYNNMFCISDDKINSWAENGECKCTFIYHLRVKEGEGEVKF